MVSRLKVFRVVVERDREWKVFCEGFWWFADFFGPLCCMACVGLYRRTVMLLLRDTHGRGSTDLTWTMT